MHHDLRPAPPVTVVIPAQGTGAHDVLRTGTDAPAPSSRGRHLLTGAAAAGVLVLAGLQAGGLPGEAGAPDRVEPVSLALVTTTASAASVRDHDGAAFATLRVRVAVRNDSRSWISLEDAALGPYRATGDGLGALPPGGLTSVPLERLVVCGQEAPGDAPRFLAVDVLADGGPSQVYLGLLEPASVDPAAVVPDCAGSRAS